MNGRYFRMGIYNDIWTHVCEYEEAEAARKRKAREAKNAQRRTQNPEKIEVPLVEDLSLADESIDGEEDESLLGATTDFKIIKNYEVPPFVPGVPNMEKNGAWKKYKDRFGKYLAFIDCVKYFRSSKYCSILALATTSNMFMNIWGTEKNVSNALKELKAIGLIQEYDSYYQTGMCKLYCYFVENERLLIDYCQSNNIPKMVIKSQQVLSVKQRNEYQIRCEEVYSEDFKKRVLFKSRVTLKRPQSVKPGQFKKDLYEMLYENYPGFKIYQEIAETVNEVYYKNQPEFHIRFRPRFHWNAKTKDEKYAPKSSIVGIGIRASNKLCSAKRDNDSIDSATKKILRSEVLTQYGFEFEKDITSSVPRVAYALNHGGWLKEDVDLYKKMYYAVDSKASEEDFALERGAIKKLFFRVYFDTTDNKLGYHTWDHMVQEGMNKDQVYDNMAKLRRAMEEILGEKRYNNYIFYVESCIYIDALHTLLAKGYKVWLVYDCFYGAGFGTKEDFEKTVLEAVWVSFVRFKLASDFNDWGRILRVDDDKKLEK